MDMKLTLPEAGTLSELLSAIHIYCYYYAGEEFLDSSKTLMIQAVSTMIAPEYRDYWRQIVGDFLRDEECIQNYTT